MGTRRSRVLYSALDLKTSTLSGSLRFTVQSSDCSPVLRADLLERLIYSLNHFIFYTETKCQNTQNRSVAKCLFQFFWILNKWKLVSKASVECCGSQTTAGASVWQKTGVKERSTFSSPLWAAPACYMTRHVIYSNTTPITPSVALMLKDPLFINIIFNLHCTSSITLISAPYIYIK